MSAPADLTGARLNLDQRGVGRLVTWGMGVVALAAFVTGAPTLYRVGLWAGLGWSALGLPIVLDLGLVLMAVSAAVARSRHARAGLLWTGTVVLTGLSTTAQAVHSLDAATVAGPALGVAVAVGACPPLVTLWATEAWIRLAVSGPERVATPTRPADATAEALDVTDASRHSEATTGHDAATPTLDAATTSPSHHPAPEALAAVSRPQPEPVAAAGPQQAFQPQSVAVLGASDPQVTPHAATAWRPTAELHTTPRDIPDSSAATVAEPAPVARQPGTDRDTPVASLTPVTRIRTIEALPADPAGQVDWIVSRARAGHDTTRETLSRLLADGGQTLSDRTLQRRLAAARDQAPDAFDADDERPLAVIR